MGWTAKANMAALRDNHRYHAFGISYEEMMNEHLVKNAKTERKGNLITVHLESWTWDNRKEMIQAIWELIKLTIGRFRRDIAKSRLERKQNKFRTKYYQGK